MKMKKVEEELQRARDEIWRIAIRIPLAGSPGPRTPTPEPLQLWRSPARPPSTSAPSAPAVPPLLPVRSALRSPIRLVPVLPTQRLRRSAITPSSPPSEPPLPLLPTTGGAGGRGGGSPPRPGQPAISPWPSPPSSESDDDLYMQNLPTERPPHGAREPKGAQLATMLTPEEIARLVGAGIAAAQAPGRPADEGRIRTLRLKMENPAKFDGKSITTFNQ